MASSYTTSFGIEKIGSGEQSGAWGTTTNHNLDILDRISSFKAVGLSGSTHTLTVREASPGSGTENLQDGMYRVIKFTGALGANNTVTVAPNTTSAFFIVINATTDSGSSGPYSVILSQGSGANITVTNGKSAVVYMDGAGSGAAVVNALSDLQIATLTASGDVTASGTLNALGDTAASDKAAVGYTSAEGLILTGQGSTNDVTIKNDADADVLEIPTGGTDVTVVGNITAGGNLIATGTVEPAGDTAAGDNAAMGYTAAEGLILTGQGSTNDVTIKNDADADVIEIPTGTVNVTMAGTLGVTGVVSGAGFTAGSAVISEAELELLDGVTAGTAIASKVVTTDANIDTTGQRNLTISGELDAASLDVSGNADIDGTLETDALSIAGTTVTSTAAELNILDGVTSTAAELNILDGATVVVGEINALDLGSTAVGTAIASKAVILDSNKDYTGIRNLTISGELDAATLDISGAIDVAGNSVLASVDVTGVATAATFEPDGDTAAGDNAAIGYTAAEGLILTGQGSTNDVTIKNDADADVIEIPTGTTNVTVAGQLNGGTIILAETDTDTSNTGSVTIDFSAHQNFVLTLTGNVTLANPSTESVGQAGVFVFIQDGTGSRTLSLGTDYESPASGGITLSTAASAVDVVPYFVKASGSIQLGAPQLAFG